MLNIQKYLFENNELDAFEYFKNVLFVDIRTKNGFTIFNYSQIDSPKENLIVKECRGLILQNNTWKVFLLPFKRFMNYGEGSVDTIDFSKAYVQEKLDGSCTSLWHDGNMWQVATRKNMYGDNTCNSFLNAFESQKTFRQLFFETIPGGESILNNLNTDCTLTFELCTSYNRVIKQYEKDSIYLLSIRNRETLKEYTSEMVKNVANELNLQTPQNYFFGSNLTPEHLIETIDNPNISARQFWIESSKHNLDNFIKAVGFNTKLKEIEMPKINLIENE